MLTGLGRHRVHRIDGIREMRKQAQYLEAAEALFRRQTPLFYATFNENLSRTIPVLQLIPKKV